MADLLTHLEERLEDAIALADDDEILAVARLGIGEIATEARRSGMLRERVDEVMRERDDLREQLREKDTALDEWIAAYHHNTAEIRRLTAALRNLGRQVHVLANRGASNEWRLETVRRMQRYVKAVLDKVEGDGDTPQTAHFVQLRENDEDIPS